MAVILRYFSEFVYLPGVLRKSSRSLSHLLMSSCIKLFGLWAARVSINTCTCTCKQQAQLPAPLSAPC